MLRRLSSLVAIMALVTALGVVGCSDDDCPVCNDDDETPELAFVGSESCAACHQDIYDTFIKSGHPYKLNMVNGTQGPTYPYDDRHASGAIVANDGPPPGTTWDMFQYVIGGYGWKARWVKPDGKIYTAGTEAQLNLWATGPEWVAYHQDEDKSYNFGCFKCHTTGAKEEGSWPDGTTGFGTFAFGGIQCEGCHNEGSLHVLDPDRFPMTPDSRKEACGSCHTRHSTNRVQASINETTGLGFIRHHEQFDEMIHSPHKNFECVTCHDPHASTVYDDTAPGQGVRTDCVACHEDQGAFQNHNALATCSDCHMPNAAKSGRSTNIYIGDVASHTWRIRTDAVGMGDNWQYDQEALAWFLATDTEGQSSITLDFACYGCHVDGDGVGGGIARPLTIGQLSAAAQGMHATTKTASR